MYYHSLYYEDSGKAQRVHDWVKRNVQIIELKVLPPDDAGLSEVQFVTEYALKEWMAAQLTANKSSGQYALDIVG